MQLFFTNESPEVAARELSDVHLNKILTEVCQCLGEVLFRKYRFTEYKERVEEIIKNKIAKGYAYNGLTNWCSERANALYAIRYAEEIGKEYYRRFGKIHKSYRTYVRYYKFLLRSDILFTYWTKPTYAITEAVVLITQKDGKPYGRADVGLAIELYKEYYAAEKYHLLTYTNASPPQWLVEHPSLPKGEWVKHENILEFKYEY